MVLMNDCAIRIVLYNWPALRSVADKLNEQELGHIDQVFVVTVNLGEIDVSARSVCKGIRQRCRFASNPCCLLKGESDATSSNEEARD